MATIKGTRTDLDNGGVVITWPTLAQASADVGSGVFVGDLDDVVAGAEGTNTNTVAMQGSVDGTNFTALGAGLTLTIGASGHSPVLAVSPKPIYIRPSTPSANTASVRVTGYRKGT